MESLKNIDGNQYISLADAKENGIPHNGDTLLYIDHHRYGFDSCSQLRFNNTQGREKEFFIKLPTEFAI